MESNRSSDIEADLHLTDVWIKAKKRRKVGRLKNHPDEEIRAMGENLEINIGCTHSAGKLCAFPPGKNYHYPFRDVNRKREIVILPPGKIVTYSFRDFEKEKKGGIVI